MDSPRALGNSSSREAVFTFSSSAKRKGGSHTGMSYSSFLPWFVDGHCYWWLLARPESSGEVDGASLSCTVYQLPSTVRWGYTRWGVVRCRTLEKLW